VALIRGNLHAHTTLSDGQRPVAEVLERYRDLGYGFVAITDHEDRIQDDYWFQIPSGDEDLIVFAGVELDYRPLSQHVGKVIGDRETLLVLNHPARYDLSVGQVLKRLKVLAAAGLAIDAVEVTNTGVYQPQYDVDEIPLPKVATDDSHRDPHLGRAWIEVEAPRDRDAILRAIKAGDFRLGFAPEPPESSGRPYDLLSLGY
jgi:PHP-associated